MKGFARIVLKVLFGSWNGIQIFFFPMLIFYWFDSTSLVEWFSGLLNTQVHQLPLTLFLLVFLYVGFLFFKFYSYISINPESKGLNRDLMRYTLDIHKGLFLILFVAIMIFVLGSFLSYFYGIKLPIRRIYASLFQYISLTLIMFYYIQSVWTAPFRRRGYSIDRSINYVILFGRRTPWTLLIFTGVIILVVICSTLLYRLVVFNGISLIIEYLNTIVPDGVLLQMISARNSGEVLLNVVNILIAFLISNLLFAPFTMLGEMLINHIHPIKLKVRNAQENPQTQNQEA
ncbi:MAG TPA: hypothetical protein PLX59_00915 [Candidatus Cloacimonadota bacterium]|nr:hypothetical protein [Candidatus Cloacimonadota bacterium]